jgi:hypothetical protein
MPHEVKARENAKLAQEEKPEWTFKPFTLARR